MLKKQIQKAEENIQTANINLKNLRNVLVVVKPEAESIKDKLTKDDGIKIKDALWGEKRMEEKNKQGSVEALMEKPIEWKYGEETFYVPSLGVDGLKLIVKLFKKIPQDIVLKVKTGLKLTEEDIERVKEFESADNDAMFSLVTETLKEMFPDNYNTILKNLKADAFISLFNVIVEVNNVSSLGRIKQDPDFQEPQPSKKS